MTGRFRNTPAPVRAALLAMIALPLAVSSFSAQTKPGAGKNIDPCALLTKAEIQEVLGKPIGDGVKDPDANPSEGRVCLYSVGDAGGFSILVKTTGPGETPDKALSEMKKYGIKTADAPNIGDRSFYVFPGGMLQLHTFKGNLYFVMALTIPDMTEDAEKGPAEKLMKKLLSKL
jgi:hypothetical protein